MNFKDFSTVVTVIAAFVGMGLGIYNLLVERSKRKVKVLVQPKAVKGRFRNTSTGALNTMLSLNDFNSEYIDEYFAIEAVNLSNFTVVIDNIGFEVSGQSTRMVIVQPVIPDEGKWPRKLDPRESVTVYCSLSYILNNQGTPKIKNAFVETSCGEVCRGTSGALKGLVDFVKGVQLQ